MQKGTKKFYRRWLFFGLALIGFIFLFLFVVAERFVEPLLKDRLHTLIIQGSDSLYTYKLGRLDASFFGGNVEVENLQIAIDSTRYQQMEKDSSLPSITMELDLIRGKIHGVGVLPLLFSKKVSIKEILSQDANIRLIRHVVPKARKKGPSEPLWKSIQPEINRIAIDKINLDGVKLLYRNADTSESLKLQFDTCNAVFNDILIDSTASVDPDRIGFAKDVAMRFRDLKFRSADSTMKLKAELITYSSISKIFEVIEFKMQPTLKEKEDFYAVANAQKGMNVIEFSRAALTNFRIDHFIQDNIISADSVLIDRPQVSIYLDKTFPPLMESKVGSYPHQKLLGASALIQIKGIGIKGAQLTYTERGEKSKQEGSFSISNLSGSIANVTNDPDWIQKNSICTANLSGKILGSSPLTTTFRFHLDSASGSFTAEGSIKGVTAAQLNPITVPLGNAQLQSFNMQQMDFSMTGDDFGTKGSVRMRYNNLYVTLRGVDKETGAVGTKKFLTKIVNKYTLQDSNPGPDGVERVAENVLRARPTTQAFFGLIWKTIFTGMQQVMMKTS